MPTSDGALVLQLVALARGARGGVLHVASGSTRAERLAQLAWRFAPELETHHFPAWDSQPFDRASPSARVLGLRVSALAALASAPAGPRLVFATPEALVQRVPDPARLASEGLSLTIGEEIDVGRVGSSLQGLGYWADERVDETGEFAVRGAVLDVFPSGYDLPVRIHHAEGRVTEIASYEAATQRTTDTFRSVRLRPVTEAGPDGSAAEQVEPEMRLGLQQRLALAAQTLTTLPAVMPGATLSLEPDVADRRRVFVDEVADAYESRQRLDRAGGRPPRPDLLYLVGQAAEDVLAGREILAWSPPRQSPSAALPDFAAAARPRSALRRFLRDEQAAGRTVLVAAAGPNLRPVMTEIEAASGLPVETVATWTEAEDAAEPGRLLRLDADLDKGFRHDTITLLAASDVLGSRSAGAGRAVPLVGGAADLLEAADRFRLDDAVIHLHHGVGRLLGLERVPAGPHGERVDTIRLEYGGGAKLMVPTADVDLMWRYGPMRSGLQLDRLGTGGWDRRRATVEREINRAAEALATEARRRRSERAERLVPPRREFERFVAAFPFSETPDQHEAVAAILADLASGTAMNRLVCGDVGFGKTEVALRAAAAVALSGRQVAIVAPTTVLVRQHVETFRRRFAEFGLEVGHLSRLVGAADGKTVKADLASGRLRIVVGTHALAGKGVAFADLGLLVIDEEQRFGAADKAKLRSLEKSVHTLTMTATPIPRTLQGVLVGLQDVSVLATPPSERVPVRTRVGCFDDATVREALMREHRRGGQSFVVCPRVEDIGPMSERLHAIAPELEFGVAHGRLKPADIDDVMVGFASGRGDVLLATNIVESGLDVPRANTIVVWRADRFGLAQLHQLRGRVGRGRLRGSALITVDPADRPAPATMDRLRSLIEFDRLGAGFDVSRDDLDARGAGDLLGDDQAGHAKLIGAGLYRRLLQRAIQDAKGESAGEEWSPELNIGLTGTIPDEFVPEPEVRLNLYKRVADAREALDEIRIADELEDRFGPLPKPVLDLLHEARLRRLCREADVAKIDAGPEAVALTFKTHVDRDKLAGVRDGLEWSQSRLIWRRSTDEAGRADAIALLLEAIIDA